MKGNLKKISANWYVAYKMEDDLIATDGGLIPLHPDSQTWMDGYHLYEDKEVEFEMVQEPNLNRSMGNIQNNYIIYAKTIDEDVNEGVNEVAKKLSFRQRCRIGNYTPFNIENLIGELSKMKKEPYITQEEFEEFHHTIMDGLNIPRYDK